MTVETVKAIFTKKYSNNNHKYNLNVSINFLRFQISIAHKVTYLDTFM